LTLLEVYYARIACDSTQVNELIFIYLIGSCRIGDQIWRISLHESCLAGSGSARPQQGETVSPFYFAWGCFRIFVSATLLVVVRTDFEKPPGDDGRRTARASLPGRNEKAGFRIRPLRAAPTISREVHSEVFTLQRTIALADGNDAACPKTKRELPMLNKILAATAVAVLAYAVTPADAARIKAGCSGDNLSKTETMIETMADGEGKIAAQKEIAAAQDAMLNGKAGACAMHLSKAMQAGAAK